MVRNISVILDECLSRLAAGETIDQCLEDYPEIRTELEPLLKTAGIVSSIPRVAPSESFHLQSKARLMARIQKDFQGEPDRVGSTISSTNIKQVSIWQMLWSNPLAKPFIPVILVIFLAISIWLLIGYDPSPSALQPAKPAEYILTVLSGDVEIQPMNSYEWQSGLNGPPMAAGGRIRTADGSSAVLTFIDGSTTRLEPNTDITVLTSEYKDGHSARIELYQHTGKTWNYVQTGEDAAFVFRIQTPSANITAQGTLFAAKVSPVGLTEIATIEGSVSVTAQNTEVKLSTEQQTKVAPGQAPLAAEPLPKPKIELILSVNNSAIGSIIDPSGASTGHLPNGLSFNQITNSRSALSDVGGSIRILEPAPGEYAVIVRSLAQIEIPLKIQVRSDDKSVSEYTELLQGTPGSGWIVRLKVVTDSESILTSSILAIEPLAEKQPENVVETILAKERATPITSKVQLPETSHVPASPLPTINTIQATPPTVAVVTPVTPALSNTGSETISASTSITNELPDIKSTTEEASTSSIESPTPSPTKEATPILTPVLTPEEKS